MLVRCSNKAKPILEQNNFYKNPLSDAELIDILCKFRNE